MTEDAIPEWALIRAREELALDAQSRGWLVEYERLLSGNYDEGPVFVLASMIAKHEQPPVDRTTAAAREVVALWHETDCISGEATSRNEIAHIARRGELDDRKDFIRVRQYLASLLAEQANG